MAGYIKAPQASQHQVQTPEVQAVTVTRLVARGRQPVLQRRGPTLSGLISADHPASRGLHPGLIYSTLSASSLLIILPPGVCTPGWSIRRFQRRRCWSSCFPGFAPRADLFDAFSVVAADHPASRGLHPGL